jgi:hypothetical protein
MIPTLPPPPRPSGIRRCAWVGLLAGSWLACLVPPASAALTWDTIAIDRVAELGASSQEFAFHFRNSGSAPVIITSVQTSCGCTSAALAKQEYGPGEGGELKVTYRFGGQVGSQEKTVSVTTKDSPDQPTVLVLRVKIPEIYSLSPRLLWWAVGEARVEKQAAISVNPALQTTVTLLPPDDPAISARLVARPDKHGYVLAVLPASTEAAQRARVDLRVEPSGLAPRIITVYVLVR